MPPKKKVASFPERIDTGAVILIDDVPHMICRVEDYCENTDSFMLMNLEVGTALRISGADWYEPARKDCDLAKLMSRFGVKFPGRPEVLVE